MVLNQYGHPVNAEMKLYKYRFPNLFFRGVSKATTNYAFSIRLTTNFNS